MTSTIKIAKIAGIGFTAALTAGHIYTRAGGFGNKEVNLRDYETAPNAPFGSPDNIQYKFRDIKKTKYVLHDKLEYSVDVYRPEGVTGSNHCVISCRPMVVIRD